MDRISQYIKSVGGIQQETWNFYYGPTGIDKVTRTQGGIQNLIIDYTTDPNGRILSMTYSEAEGYSGELFAVFNNFGDISAWVDSNGFTKYAAIYDLNNGLRNELYNPPPGINVPLGFNGRNGDITIQVGADRDLIVNNEGSDFSITNPWGATDTMGWARPPKTTKGGGDGEACGKIPCQVGVQVWQWGIGIGALITPGRGWFKWGKIPGPIDWELTEEFFPSGNGIAIKLLDILIPDDKLIDLLSSLGVGYRIAEKLGGFTLDCHMKGRITMNCTVIECPKKRGKSPTCGLDCECVGNDGSDKKTIC